jgi:(p)ppGpp synthase/HD superfamily hydrolase
LLDTQDQDYSQRILEFLQKKQSATNTAIAKEFSLEEKRVNEILDSLRREGCVQFQQELHLTRGELIMAKITGKGTTALLALKEEEKPPPDKPTTAYDFERIVKAIEFATGAHRAQFRKGTTIPYIVHPLDVLSILLKSGAGEDLVIAGVLHDVLEDTPRSKDEIRKDFGNVVGSLVEGASESEALTKGVSNEEKKKTWKLRKSERITKVRTAGRELRLLICADKLANIRDLLEDQRSLGEGVWAKFNASKVEQSWYYHEIAAAMILPKGGVSDLSDAPAYRELQSCIRQVFGS